MTRRIGQAALWLLLAYSALHFFHSGMGGINASAADRCRGDFLSAFPGPYVAHYNPALLSEFEGYWWRQGSGSEALWNYGPAFHLVTLPLTVLPTRAMMCPIWMFINVCLVAASAVLLFRTAVRPEWSASWALRAVYAGLWLNFYPLLTIVRQGNIEIAEFFLVVLAYHWLAAGTPGTARRSSWRDTAAGATMGVAAMTKFLPLIFLPYFALKKRWRTLLVAVVVVVALVALAELLLGWEKSVTWLSLVSGMAQGSYGQGEFGRGYAHNQSLAGMVWRAFATFPRGLERTTTAWIDVGRMDVIGQVVKLAIVVAMAACAWLLIAKRKTSDVHLEVSLLAAFMIFIPPWNWDYYQIFLLLPLSVLLLRYVWGARRRRWWWGGGFAALYVATGSVVLPSSAWSRLVGWPDSGLTLAMQNLSLPGWANAGLVVWLAGLYWQSADRAARVQRA